MFAGWASDGRENGVRPRAFYRRCTGCGLQRLVLGNVEDAEGLCRAVLREWLRRVDTSARVGPVGAPTSDGRIDPGDALGWLQHRVWELYVKWDPMRSPSFLAFAHELLSKGVRQWAADESGEPSDRAHGRRSPKAHAASVSTSLDGLAEAVDGMEHLDLGSALDAYTSDAEIDALRRSPLPTRRLVLLLYSGFDQTEAAAKLGVSPHKAGQMLKRLRAEISEEP